MPRTATAVAAQTASMLRTLMFDGVATGWLSYGSHAVYGVAVAVRSHKLGLAIVLNTGRVVVWRLSLACRVLASLGLKVAA